MPFIKISIEIPTTPVDKEFEKVKVESAKTMLNLPIKGRSPIVKVREKEAFKPVKKLKTRAKGMPKTEYPKPGKSIMTREKPIPFSYTGDQDFKQLTKALHEQNES